MSTPKPVAPDAIRIDYVGPPGPASSLPPRRDAYRTKPGALLTVVGVVDPASLVAARRAGEKAA